MFKYPEHSSATLWDTIWSSEKIEEWDPLSQAILDFLLEKCAPVQGKTILEAGSGSGRISYHLAKLGAEVTLLDFSESALHQSQIYFQQHNVNGKFIKASIEEMPFPDETFDVVWNAGVLEHYPFSSQLKQIKEMARVLKPQGLLIVLAPNAACIFYRVAKWVLEVTGKWRFGYENPFWSLRPLLESAGLEVIGEEPLAFNVALDYIKIFPETTELARFIQHWHLSLPTAEQKHLPGYLLGAWARKKASSSSIQKPTASTYTIAEPEPTIICLSTICWEDLWQRPQQLMSQFQAMGYRIIFVDGRDQVVKVEDTDLPPDKLRSLIFHYIIHNTRFATDKIAYLKPIVAISDGYTILDIRSLFLHILHTAFNCSEVIYWVQYPVWAKALENIAHNAFVVYDCVDYLPALLPHTEAPEQQLANIANIVFVTSPSLGDHLSAARHLYVLPNGVDPLFFALPRKKSMKRWPSPVLGFVGAISFWVDLELLHKLASRNPNWTFVLAGPTYVDVSALRQCKNVHFLGQIPYSELPELLAQFNIGIVPFKLSEVTYHANPIKVYEYLAAGLPVVASPLPDLNQFGNLVRLATTVSEWEKEITLALAEDGHEAVEQRRKFILRHSWQSRCQVFVTLFKAYRASSEGRFREALNIINHALEKLPGDPALSLERDVLKSLLGDFKFSSIERAHEVVEHLIRRGHRRLAIKLLHYILRRDPQDPDTRYNLALIISSGRHYTLALRYLKPIITSQPDKALLELLGSILQELGMLELAYLAQGLSQELNISSSDPRLRQLSQGLSFIQPI